jgi:hypothetical protein
VNEKTTALTREGIMKNLLLLLGPIAAFALVVRDARATGEETGNWVAESGNGNGEVSVEALGLVGDNNFEIWLCGETSNLTVYCNHATPAVQYGSLTGWYFQLTPVYIGCGYASYYEYVIDNTTNNYVSTSAGSGKYSFAVGPGC